MLKIVVVKAKEPKKEESSNAIAFPADIMHQNQQLARERKSPGFLERQTQCAELILKELEKLVQLPSGEVIFKRDMHKHGYKLTGEQEEVSG